MKDNYDLKNPRPNPFAERMKGGYTIIIDRDANDKEEYRETETDDSQQFQAKTRTYSERLSKS